MTEERKLSPLETMRIEHEKTAAKLAELQAVEDWKVRKARLQAKREECLRKIAEIDALLAVGPEMRGPWHLRSNFDGDPAYKKAQIDASGAKVIGG